MHAYFHFYSCNCYISFYTMKYQTLMNTMLWWMLLKVKKIMLSSNIISDELLDWLLKKTTLSRGH